MLGKTIGQKLENYSFAEACAEDRERNIQTLYSGDSHLHLEINLTTVLHKLIGVGR